MSEQITIVVSRYQPEADDEPWEQSYVVDYQPDLSVLEALNLIKDDQDSSLSYRWSCRMAICGSCGMMINDKPVLACSTFLRDFDDTRRLHVRALDNFPIERDLVSDISGFVDHLTQVQPYMMHDAEKPTSEGEFLQTPEELERYASFSDCINCGLCYAACPQFGRDPNFLGPAALTLAQRYNLDSRDDGAEQRMQYLNAEQGVWSCTFVGYCTEVCPKDVDPAAAINRGKVSSTINYSLNLLNLGRKGPSSGT